MSATGDSLRSHERLIDHFKRVYSIVAGLALTDACRRTLPVDHIRDFRVWMFAALFITLVPIFHGGDRSLDQKHLGRPASTLAGRLAFLWDDYMLLLTAVLFVCIADSIPTKLEGEPQLPAFYGWLALMLAFDVFVLLVDLAKNWARRAELQPYKIWIPSNVVLGAVCFWVSRGTVPDPRSGLVVLPGFAPWQAFPLSLFVFILALLRTGLDYLGGEDFLFPRRV